MRKNLLLKMALTIAVIVSLTGCLEIPETDSETYEDITWIYDFDTQILKFSGRGEIRDWDGAGRDGSQPPRTHYDKYYNVTKKIILKEGITSIAYNAFCGFSLISSISIPNSVTSIGESAFEGCDGLSSITIPNNVTSIEKYAICCCDNLVSVTIGNSVTYIGRYAFVYCSNLTSVTCKATTPPSLYSNAFDHPENIDLYVPSGSVNAYKKDSSWGKFKSINAL